MDSKSSIQQQEEGNQSDEKKPIEKKKRIKKEKVGQQGNQGNQIQSIKKNQNVAFLNQQVALKKNQQQNGVSDQVLMNHLSSIKIPEELRLFFMRELRQTVPVVREILPQHKFLLFGEIPLDLDFFINKMKIRQLDSNCNIFDKFRSIQRNIKYKNRIEFDLDSQYVGLSDFQYIIEALRSMNNNTAFAFAQCLQDYQNSVRHILARNDYYKQYLANQNIQVNLNDRIKKSIQCASDILDGLDPDNEIFIYNIISKQFNGLVTLKKGFSKGLVKNLGVTDEEFIISVQENKVFHTLVDQVNHASIIYSQTKMEENPYLRLRPLEVIKSIHPDIAHHHSHQFQNILRNLVKEAIKKQDVIEQFLSPPRDEMIDDEMMNYVPNPLPTFSQYQQFIKNINLHPHRFKFPPHKQIELFQNITQVLTKKQLQSKLDFQQNLEKITKPSILSKNESSSTEGGQMSIEQQQYVTEQNGGYFQRQQSYSKVQPHLLENSKEQNDNLQVFNEYMQRKSSDFDSNSQISLNPQIFVDPYDDNYADNPISDDNLSIMRDSKQPIIRSLSQQQFGNVSQGMVTSLFNEYNSYQNTQNRSVNGDLRNSFDDEMSSSLFYDQQSFFGEFNSSQNQRGDSSSKIQTEQNNQQPQVLNTNLSQNSFKDGQQESNYSSNIEKNIEEEEEKRQNIIRKFNSTDDQSNKSDDEQNSSSIRSKEQAYHQVLHWHSHYHHYRMLKHKPYDFEDSISENPGQKQKGDKSQKENKIKDFYEQLLQYIGNDEEEDGLFPFPHINSTFKEDIIREYELLRSLLEDGKYMTPQEFTKFIDDINQQPRIKKKQYLKHLMKIPDHVDYEKKERRKREEKEKRRKAEKKKNQSNSNESRDQTSPSISPLSVSPTQSSNPNVSQFVYPQQQNSQSIPTINPPQNQQSPFSSLFDFSSSKIDSKQINEVSHNSNQIQPNQQPNPQFHQIFDQKQPNLPNQQQQQGQQINQQQNYQNNDPHKIRNQPLPHFIEDMSEESLSEQPQIIQPSFYNRGNNINNHPHHINNNNNPPPQRHPPPQIPTNNNLNNNLPNQFENHQPQGFPFGTKPHYYHHPHPHLHHHHPHHHSPPPHPMQLVKLIREYFQTESITDQSELLANIKNTLQEAISQGQLNKKVGDFLSQENNIEKATEVINQIISDKDEFNGFREGGHPPPHPHHHHQHKYNPHKRQESVIKKIYELNTNLSLDEEIQINDYLEVFYIGKTKLWKNFSKDFILNNSFRDVEDEINKLRQNELIQKYYPSQVNNIAGSMQQQQQHVDQITNHQSHLIDSPSSSFLNPSKDSNELSNQINPSNALLINGTPKKINKELLQKIINQFKMGPPHPFKILLLLKKALQKIVKHIPGTYLTQPFIKNSLKMIVYLIQGDIENFISCRKRIPIEIIESMEKKVMKKFSQIPII